MFTLKTLCGLYDVPAVVREENEQRGQNLSSCFAEGHGEDCTILVYMIALVILKVVKLFFKTEEL